MKKYWKSIEELQGSPEIEKFRAEEDNSQVPELFDADLMSRNSSRRDFLKLFGFSITSAAIIASCKRPVINAIPYAVHPPEITPGKSLYYASTYFDGHEYCSILVKTRDGRPIKIEGNALSGFNNEGTTARVQASVLSLYDDARLKSPMADNSPASWDVVDSQILKALETINSVGGEVALLTSTINSPSTIRLIQEFGSRFTNFRWVQYDAISYSAILEANNLCFGKAAIPDYNFQNADYVVSFFADFLGTWVAPVHFIPKYVSRRKLDNGEKDMLRHIQLESGLTVTGSNADQRIRIRPSEEKAILHELYNRLSGKQATGGSNSIIDLGPIAEKLLASKGRSIVISGTNNTDIQIIVNGINNLLGNYSGCIDLTNNINIAAGIDRNAEALLNDMNSGKIKALFMHNVNPVYDFPGTDSFLTGLKNLELTVNMHGQLNETTGIAKYECPVPHYLETWNDSEIVPGQLSLCQPCINPVFDTRSFQDSLLKWSGNQTLWHDYLMSSWEKQYFPASGQAKFQNFWDDSLGKGVLSYEAPSGKQFEFNGTAVSKAVESVEDREPGDFEIHLYESVSMGTGMNANNPWLMELPDPVSKQSWENAALISPADASKLAIVNGDLVKIGEEMVLPALVQPGQADGTISISVGFGHTNSGQVANNAGVNVFPYARIRNGNRQYKFGASVEKTGSNKTLALTQVYNTMEGRPIVRETVFSKYRENHASGNELHEEFESKHKTLYPDQEFVGFHWGMVIDLNSCIGCNTCVIACQAENNIPVVGKAEVINRRIMHWIKIDRYYSESPENPQVYFQPLPCMHCDNAPCENVCPVSATNHSSEGLNQMAYNRCIGTKYCINNCPYKVRRFNWYRYTNNKAFDFHTASDLGRMVLNPDVTVRERGVVEKCTFCVQRIQEKKLQAKLENRVLEDFEVKTACMQACPAGAITFGNLNDKNSKVSKMMESQRNYHLLEELHTLPSVGYLTKVWKDEETKS